MPTFPGLTYGGSIAISTGQYPLGRSIDWNTQVVKFTNGESQRWLDRLPINSFVIELSQVHWDDRYNIEVFFGFVGSFTEWTFPLVSGFYQNYNFPHCVFDQDYIEWVEQAEYPGQYETSIRCKQVAFGGGRPFGGSIPFPSFGPGYTTGYPFSRTVAFSVTRSDLESGNRIGRQLSGAGIATYPTRAMYSWKLTLSTLGDEDLAVLESHFLAMGGGYRTFPFTDPTDRDNRTFNSVRYSDSILKIQYVQYGVYSVTVSLEEAFGPGWIA